MTYIEKLSVFYQNQIILKHQILRIKISQLMKMYTKLTFQKKIDTIFFFLQNVTQHDDVFEALIGAIFFDSSCSLKVVWDVIDRLVRQYTGKSIY